MLEIGRVASIEAKIDGLATEINGRFRSMDERYKSFDQRMGRVESSISSLRTTIIVTALSAVIAIVLGVAAFNATMFSNMLSAFESGKETSAVQAELKRQAEETAALLKRLQARVDAPQPSHPDTSRTGK